MGILDLFFPKYCVNCKKLGAYACDACFATLSFDTYGKCLVCGRASFNSFTHPVCRKRFEIDGAFCSIAYKGVAKKLLYVFKYKPYVSDLQTFLGELIYESLIQNEFFASAMKQLNNQTILLVPIPLHKNRFYQRGYNHAFLLAKELAAKFGYPCEDILIRVKETKSQYGLKQKEREENMKGAFAIKKGSEQKVSDSFIFLVDDILTTGSTLREAAKVLKRFGAKKVWGLALAQD